MRMKITQLIWFLRMLLLLDPPPLNMMSLTISVKFLLNGDIQILSIEDGKMGLKWLDTDVIPFMKLTLTGSFLHERRSEREAD